MKHNPAEFEVNSDPATDYTPIEIDRINLTIMGISFPDLETLESVSDAIGSNMFEGFKPTPKSIEIIRDYTCHKITLQDLIRLSKEKAYAQ
jgi:putative transcriptional regulator